MKQWRLFWIAACGVALPMLVIGVLHAPPVRRAALAWISAYLSKSQGIVLQAQNLDYNLLSPWFILEKASLRYTTPEGSPPFLTAEGIRIRLRFHDLLRGSLRAQSLEIKHLWLDALVRKDGITNLSGKSSGASGRKPMSLPIDALEIANLSLSFNDDQSGFSARFPGGTVQGSVDPQTGAHRIAYSLMQRGTIGWGGRELPVENLGFDLMLQDNAIALKSLHMTGKGLDIDAAGTVRDLESPQLSVLAHLAIEGAVISPWLGLKEPPAGRVRATVSAAGTLKQLTVEGELRGNELKYGGFDWDAVDAKGSFESSTGVLELKELTATMNGGQIQASGRISLLGEGRSTIQAEGKTLDLRRIGAGLGWAAAPRGEVSAQVTVSCPGSEWKNAALNAKVVLALNTGARIRPIPTITADLKGQFSEQRVHVGLDSVSGYGTRLQGFLDVGIRDQLLEGELTGKTDSLLQLTHNLEGSLGRSTNSFFPVTVDGSAEWRATLSGTLQDPRASMTVEGAGISAGRVAGAGLHLQGQYEPDRFLIRAARLDWNGQEAVASGEIGLASGNSPLHIEAGAEHVSIAETLQGLNVKEDVHGTARAKITATGTRSDPRVNILLEAQGIEAYGELLGNLGAEAEWKDRSLTLNRLKLEKPQADTNGTLEAHGTVNFETRVYQFSLAGENLQLPGMSWLRDIPVTGTLRLDAGGQGSLDNPAMRVEAEWKDLRIADETFGVLRGVMQVSDHQARLKIDDAALGMKADADIAMQGPFPIRFEFTADKLPYALKADGKRVATITSAAEVSGVGSLRPAKIQAASALLKELQIEIGKNKIHSEKPIAIGYDGRAFQLQPTTFASGTIRVDASGEMPLSEDGAPGKISVKGNIDLNSLVSLLAAEETVKARGHAILDAEIGGNWQSLHPSATLTLEGGYLESAALPGALEDLRAAAKLTDRRITIDSLSAKVGAGTIRASADMPLDFVTEISGARETSAGLPARFSVEADRVPLSRQAGQSIGMLSARLAGTATAPRLDAVTAQLDLTEFSLTRDAFSIRQAAPATLSMEGGRLEIGQWHWTSPQGELQLSGTVGLTGKYPLDMRVSGNADAAICSLLSPSATGKGSLRIDLQAYGTLLDPSFSGLLEMEKGSIGIQQPRLLVEDLDLKIKLDQGRWDIQTLEGLLNGGRIRGSGGALVSKRKLAAINADLTGQDVFLEFPQGARTSSNLRFQVRQQGSEVVIGGEVEIREGSYVEPFDFSGKSAAMLSGNMESSNRTQVLGASVRYDIKIKTLQPFEINNNLARISARADMRLVGDPKSPGMLGTMTLDRGGKIYFGGRTYYTERGVVTFTKESRIDPLYDLVATTQVNEYQVSLRLSGTVNEITATFTSDPPLSQNDIVALLLTGKPLSESGGSRVDPVAQAERMSVLSGVLNADLSARMRRRFGISQVMIQPSLITGESDPGARLTVGQDLSQSLRLVYSMNLVNSADQIWYTEYDFQRRFTARAVMQRDNTYRTDFQQDFRFGGRKSAAGELAASSKLRVGNVEFTGNPVIETSRLAREFKIAPGSKFNFAKARKGVERLQKFYNKNDYLAARVYMNREDKGPQVNLTVQIEAGKKVRMQYEGAKIPKSVNKQVLKIWREGISDRQRTEDAEQALRIHFAKHGNPQANVAGKINEVSPGEERVQFNIQEGVHYQKIQTIFEGAAPEHAASIAARLKQRGIPDVVISQNAPAIDEATSYYEQKGYYLAKVSAPRLEPDEARKTAAVVYHVEEGPQIRIRALEFRGNNALTTAELKRDLPLKEGSVLDPAQLRTTTTAIAEKYGRNGYRNPRIDPTAVLDEKKGVADLTFVVLEGVKSVIQSLEVEGQERVSEEYIRRQLRIAEGKPQDVPETSRSIRNLYNTGAFASVDVVSVPGKGTPASDQGTENVDVRVKVQEVAPYKFLYALYYDSGRGPGGLAEIENRNLLGAARVIGLRGRYDSGLQEGRVYFSQPLWRGHVRPTTATVFYRNEDDYYEGLAAQRFGFTLQQEIALKKKLVVSYGYRFEDVDSFYPDHRAPDPPRAIVAPLTLSLSRSTRDDFLDPTVGSFMSTGMEIGTGFLGTTFPYTRVFAQYFKYFPLRKPGFVPFKEDVKKPRVVYATGVRLGVIKGLTTDQVIPTERFYAGGGTTVRGFKQDTLGPLDSSGDPLGGNAMLVLNNELRFPMRSIFDGVGFVDIGNVFPLVSDFKLSELRKTAGFGLRVHTPSLMLRFDYGFKLDRRPGESTGAFFFSIGQAF